MGARTVTHKVLQLLPARIMTALAVVLGERRLKIGQQLEDTETLARQMEKGYAPRPRGRSGACRRARYLVGPQSRPLSGAAAARAVHAPKVKG